MEMGKEIRRLRQDRGLTQEALAADLHVTAQTVSKWECGNSVPDVQMLPEIAVYFGVTIDQLFAMSPEQQLERMENHIYARGLFPEAEQRYFCAYAARKDGHVYKNSHDEIMVRYGANLVMQEEMPEIDWPQMGRYAYMAKFPTEEEMREFFSFVLG